MPTAIFSNHTAFESFNFFDLTDYLTPMAEEIKKQNVHFDAIYTGYLANGAQAEIIKNIAEFLSDEDTRLIVDPAMADNGKLYACLPENFPGDMKKLCRAASVVTPNVTEAMLLLGRETVNMPQTQEECGILARELGEDLGTDVVLTSVRSSADHFGCAVWENAAQKLSFVSFPYVDHSYHGTGDIFSSVLTAAILADKPLTEATEIAAAFVRNVIADTAENHPNLWYGVNFEKHLQELKF